MDNIDPREPYATEMLDDGYEEDFMFSPYGSEWDDDYEDEDDDDYEGD